MVDLGSVDVFFYHRIPCNDTLYQMWEMQPNSGSQWEDYNTCLNYDYPQEVGGEDKDTDTARDEDSGNDTNVTREGDPDNAGDINSSNTSNEDGTSNSPAGTLILRVPIRALSLTTPTVDDMNVPGNAASAICLPATGGVGFMLIAIISISLY
ncbi:hypothetical protein BDW72DRAFT_198069 [Aspergillus terricola var. indicus]